MRTEKELVQATLADLANQLLENQMELRLLKMNQSDIEAALLSSLNEELRITKIINGGLNGEDQRLALYEAAKEALA